MSYVAQTKFFENEAKSLESVLKNHSIDIPVFKKAHWKEIKDVPKDQRPKPPKLKKVEGLLLGIRECSDSVQNGGCSAIVLEANMNPRLIVHPLLEMCSKKQVPYLCLPYLKTISANCFGVPTSCLGIKTDHLLDIKNEIVKLAKNYPQPKPSEELGQVNKVEKIDINKMDITENTPFTFLYRKRKSERIFVPSSQDKEVNATKKFIGQDFIEFSEKKEEKSKAYMKMIVKRITSNPARVKNK
ncbi:unnamed protein product [Chrysodeixis includens]|uniref:Ribosomal protein L7Ae/L30e/S12e/Gadd45 domain-containing protein n=1 Tax=Chrysodeixis includens TaxID=689277 RepID=A0A9P0BR76_CHRIL|nr:unnamed protein product [Chrysodeixis includens]